MRIYIGHSAGFDYEKELYNPLKASELYEKHEIFFPHDGGVMTYHKKDFYSSLDLFVAEVSYPSTGLGIELAWAADAGRKIICIHRVDKKPSLALKAVCADIRGYRDAGELIEILKSVTEISA